MKDIKSETNEKYVCSDCGEEFSSDELTLWEGDYYCDDCLDKITIICEHCGDRVDVYTAIMEDDFSLCEDCYDNYYTRCNNCDCIIERDNSYGFEDDDNYYCRDCYEQEKLNRPIHDYYYKPDPVFWGNGNRYIGIELEVDIGGEDKDNASTIINMANNDFEDRLYIKHDGSLDDGFEIVSHPMSIEYHKNTMPWKKIVKEIINMGYTSHNASTCGLHCHVNRNSFGGTTEEQEAAIARVLYFIEHHWSEILKFSRRTPLQMEKWANRYGRKSNPYEFIDTVKNKNSERYSCVNILNYNTIEFRMFRGTLKYNTLMATLEFVEELCEMSVNKTDEEIADMSWLDFVQTFNKETRIELITYLKERNLYVNEKLEEREGA